MSSASSVLSGLFVFSVVSASLLVPSSSIGAVPAAPRSGGIFGFSGNPNINSGRDCNSCHGGGTPPIVSLTGPGLVQAGRTYRYELLVGQGQSTAAGLGVSVTEGVLAPADNETRVDGDADELTQTAPKTVDPNNEARFHFDWTAPANGGTPTMYASGNSVNRNFGSGGDASANAQLQIQVEDCLVSWEQIGVGTPGSGGFVPVLSGVDAPCAGGASLEIRDGFGGATAFLWLTDGEAEIDLFGGKLYLDLSGLFFRLPIRLQGAQGVPGAGTFSAPTPDLGFAQGFQFFIQCLSLDPGAFKGVSLSNAVRLDIGV